MSAPPDAELTIAKIIKRKLDQARDQLIDRNLRNRLLNCPLTSKRSKQVRVVDELPDEIFRSLLAQKKELTFAAGRGVVVEDVGEADPDHGVWTPPEDDAADDAGVARRHRDNVLQTQLTAEGLQKRLSSLYYESREVEQEQGVNVLYLALGFLKWFEDGRSEVERYAPLVLVPIELTREGARDKFRLKARDEDMSTNVSLKIWLTEQQSIQLPELPDSDDWLPSEYFDQVRKAISSAARWEVLDKEILLGFFSFSKFLLWRDLDPANWPTPDSLLGHGVLRTLLAPHEENPIPDPPVVPHDRRVDDVFKSSELVHVLDADSSQTMAIQTALAGRNLVIQGPPGTGKSQTIANIIAAAIHQGKSVLFVAEKLAALQVVYQRLKEVHLGPLCLELHSRRASKMQVLGQIRDAMDAPAPAGMPGTLCQHLDEHASFLSTHVDRIHTKHAPGGHTAFATLGTICGLRDKGVAIPDFEVKSAETWTGAEIDRLRAELDQFAERLAITGVPAKHPWRGCERDTVNPLDAQRLAEVTNRLSGSVEALVVILRTVWSLVRGRESDELQNVRLCDLATIADALALAGRRPEETMDVLCSPRWARELPELTVVLDFAKRLAEIERQLAGVFTEAAWYRDWVAERSEIAASGRSFVRILRGPYRAAIRTVRGVCRSELPKTYEARIEALDALMEGQSLRGKLAQSAPAFQADLGAIWKSLPSDWERLARLVGWLRAAVLLEPKLSIRNPNLLGRPKDSQKWSEHLRHVATRAHENLQEVSRFVQLVEPTLMGEQSAVVATVGQFGLRARGWKESIERINEWPPVRHGLARLAEVVSGAFERRVFEGSIQARDLSDRVHLAILEQVWNRLCREDAELSRMDGRVLDNKVLHFRELDRKRISVAAEEVARKHFDEKPTGHAGEMAIVRGELNKVRRHLATRELLKSAGHAVQQLKPVFLMSPLSVAQYLLPGHLKFDLLLVDEASQIRPEDALGAAARASQLVVVGDPKQLPPTNFFNRLVDDSDAIDNDEDSTSAGPQLGAMESILSLCDTAFANRRMLDWHYRSLHPALIAVSNRNFYGNKLLLPPAVVTGRATEDLGVAFRKTPAGGYDRGRTATNTVEAEVVAEAVCEFARKYPEKSLGVGTFSVAQRDVIRELIESKRRADPTLDPFFATSRQNEFFVKNLESIQGDERDVIFISVGYGRGSDNRLTTSFGPINAEGGERRLNVLISRAKERCEVFSSITADEIDNSRRRPGVAALKEFLQYADKGYFDVPQRSERTFDSDFEESVAVFLRQRNYKIDPQVGMAGFYIDIGVRHPKDDGRYVLGIECDGATYHSSRSARDRDRLRQQILESRGWRIHRIWSTDWFHRRSEQERRLLDTLAGAEKGEIPCRKSPPPQPAPHSVADAPKPPPLREADPRSAATNYVEANFDVNSVYAPHEAPANQVQGAIEKIVSIEGPIHTDEVARRVATVWGLDRAGSRIQDATQGALKALLRQGRLDCVDEFWSLASGAVLKVRNRSDTRSLSLRKAEYLPPTEMALAAIEILRESVRVPLDDLIVEIARRLGFQRTGQDLQDAIAAAIASQVGKAFLHQDDGSLMLGPRPG